MDESLQQLLALIIVAAAIGAELWRRHRRKTKGKAGCEGCSTNTAAAKGSSSETPIRFYQRR